MKKFIDRMESAQAQGDISPPSGTQEKGGKKKWGLGGMVRRVTGTGTGSSQAGSGAEVKKESSDSSAEEGAGLQVDFYLVIVSCQDSYGNQKLTISSSSLSLVSYPPLR
jgi:ubiquitin-like-conjugating enzyme ATG3